MSPPNI